MVLSVACVVMANLDKLGDFTASGAGVAISVKRAESAVEQMTELTRQMGGLEANFQQLLVSLDVKTMDLVSHITGGKSSPYVVVAPGPDNALNIMGVAVHGDHSLRDVKVRIVDSGDDPLTAAGTKFDIGIIPFGHIHWFPASVRAIPQSDKGRLIVFFSALNGTMYQFLDYKKVDGKWCCATRLLAHGELIFQKIDAGFGPQPSEWAAETRRIKVTLENETPETLRAKGIEDDFAGWTRTSLPSR